MIAQQPESLQITDTTQPAQWSKECCFRKWLMPTRNRVPQQTKRVLQTPALQTLAHTCITSEQAVFALIPEQPSLKNHVYANCMGRIPVIALVAMLGAVQTSNAIEGGWRVLPGRLGADGKVQQAEYGSSHSEHLPGYLLVERVVRPLSQTGMLPASNIPARYAGFGRTPDVPDGEIIALEGTLGATPLDNLLQLPATAAHQQLQLEHVADIVGSLPLAMQALALNSRVQPMQKADANDGWRRSSQIGRGAQGEVWKARRLGHPTKLYALKRIFNAGTHSAARRQGIREAHFGLRLRGVQGCSQYIEHFWTTSDDGSKDLWIAFEFHGASISSLLYDVTETGLLKPSRLWHSLHAHADGASLFKNITAQVIHAVAAAHERNIVHRDIKPSNILLVSDERGAVRVTIADWSSAIDSAHHSRLYGAAGPSVHEQTIEYAAPETRMTNGSTPFAHAFPESYDSWSVGATLVELLLAARPSQWLTVSRREEMRLRRSMQVTSDLEALTAMTLMVFRQWCLWGLPHSFQVDDGEANSQAPCPSFQGFQYRFKAVAQAQLKGHGMTADHVVSDLGQDLLFWLLLFDPSHRLTVADAAGHPFLADSQ